MSLEWMSPLLLLPSLFAQAKVPAPKVDPNAYDPAGPPVLAKSAILVDATSGKVLWEQDADTPRYPASTTKILTTLILLERVRPETIITAPKDIEKVGESSMHLKPGERVPAKDMAYALMLRSANDGCVAVARHISGTVEAFADVMNARAAEMGCTRTEFTNPNGLNDVRHVTTARDLAIMGRIAMQDPTFRQIARTRKYKIRRSINQKDQWMVSRNKWLAKDPSADGIKTGYTRPAGNCYVGSATREGFRVITVLMDSPAWQTEHGSMLRWAYRTYDRFLIARAGETIGTVSAPGIPNPIPVITGVNTYEVRRPTEAAGSWGFVPRDDLSLPILAKQRVGTATFTSADGHTTEYPVFAADGQTAPPPIIAGTSGRPDGGTLAIGAALLGGIAFLRHRTRRQYDHASPRR
ncbi:MAG: D-alanyl-D-alanine carboxypeptidase family protein [Fimbriimonadaceae bacterium]|nr:D-alanyl-D-alanine carboxypeptidase family protein [Fimbriimonadaceae bacterium]